MTHWLTSRNTLLLCVFGLTLAACSISPTSTPSPSRSSSPAISPEPTCYVQPLPTGEKYVSLTVNVPPPPQAQPGETITFSFSGGYLIVHQARICGDGEIVGYMYADELPGFSYRRTVKVSLDNEGLVEMECDFDCHVEVTIPVSTSPGSHRLRVGPPFGFRELDFELEISR